MTKHPLFVPAALALAALALVGATTFTPNDANMVLTGTLTVGGVITGNGSGLTNLPSSEVGVTDASSATAGNVGEVVSALKAVGSAQALQTTVPTNITSISLTAGDWDVEGNASFVGTTATVTATAAGIVTTANTIPADGSEVYSGVTVTLVSETDGVSLPRKRVNVSGTTIVYLTGRCTFTAGSVLAFGSINARRVR